MADYKDITGDIKAKLEAVPGTGIVHEYERQSVDMGKFIQLFKTPENKICGCEITRTAISERWLSGMFYGNYRMVVRLYLGILDASESSIAFQQLVDAIRSTFRNGQFANQALGLSYFDYDSPDSSPVQVPVMNDRMFGAVLCHCAEIHIAVQHRIPI